MATGQAPGRSHVAALLGMKAVQPRAIAYVAVQVGILINLDTLRKSIHDDP
jgi:hypothetical protein